MITCTITAAKARLSALLDEVESGGEVEITRRGRVVARLVPASGDWAALEAWVREKPANPTGITVEQMRAADIL